MAGGLLSVHGLEAALQEPLSCGLNQAGILCIEGLDTGQRGGKQGQIQIQASLHEIPRH